MRREPAFVVSCEHASARVPATWRAVLRDYLPLCDEHEVRDPGIGEIGRELAGLLEAPYFPGTFTRLLVDLNRSINHPELFSPPVRELPARARTDILCEYYHPYRHRVRQEIENLVAADRPVIHLSIHSFTPELHGRKRRNDFGLLFDPWRKGEDELAEPWLHLLRRRAPDLICTPNEPYTGTSDGHVPVLRRYLRRASYLGYELEFNQKLPLSRNAPAYARWIQRTLRAALASHPARL